MAKTSTHRHVCCVRGRAKGSPTPGMSLHTPDNRSRGDGEMIIGTSTRLIGYFGFYETRIGNSSGCRRIRELIFPELPGI
ncbi:hypothetical protein M407DRAFT_244225 [Tulasnella calospora MUT 4182]|uniref:Uncharacterized protein n=1 Tax=Tulasnella calospora MUT 4182 TaxID=1051891 RepID=A0A0C3LUC2_9AGAM|nr:hypothetical protein M407DRAFT_244225 [Tulasnella calospora MUT 4182]